MGNSASLDRLVLDHLPAAQRFATRLVGNPQSAEDLVQESLVRVVRRWRSFRGEAEFRTWFFRIIINVFRDRLRASPVGLVSSDESEAELVDPTTSGPVETTMASELEQIIAQEISRLPPRQREVLVLIAFEGVSPREAAQILGISEANVHSTESLARARLKTRLAPYVGSIEK